MPALLPIVLTDGITPQTLNPSGRVGNKTTFRSTDKATLETQSTLDVTVNDNSLSQRVIMKYSDPQEFINADNGLTEFVDTAIGDINMRIPRAMTPAARELFVRRMFSHLLDATLASVALSGENFWA